MSDLCDVTNGGQFQRAARKRAAPHASAEPSQSRHPAGSWQGTGPGPPVIPGRKIGETVSPMRPADLDSLKTEADEERAPADPRVETSSRYRSQGGPTSPGGVACSE